jgi:CxxC-x17-CxxC domain-containing protein
MRNFVQDKAGFAKRGATRRDSGRFGARDEDRFSSDRRSFSGPRTNRREGPLEMHKVTCSKCGIECEVPFKPTSSKPVYCSDCFNKTGDRGGSSNRSSEDLAIINIKLDKIMKALKID